MVLIQVEYDAYTRQFKLIDSDMAHALVDGVTYMVFVDTSAPVVADAESADIETVIA